MKYLVVLLSVLGCEFESKHAHQLITAICRQDVESECVLSLRRACEGEWDQLSREEYEVQKLHLTKIVGVCK